NSRAELLIQRRHEKAQNLQTYKLKKMEKLLLAIENTQIPARIAMGFYGVHPLFGGLKTGAGTGGGVLYDPTQNLKHFRFSLKAAFSVRSYQLYQAILGYEDAQSSVFGYVRYQDSPQEDFFGIGANSLEANRTNFSWQDTNIGGAVGLRLHRNISTILNVFYSNNKIRAGTDKKYPSTEERFEEPEIPGFGNDMAFVVAKANITFDSRNVFYPENATMKHALTDDPLRHRTANPYKGTLISLEASRYKDQSNGQFDFKRLEIEFQQYIPFYKGHQVIAFRHFGSIVDRDSGADIPFYLMQHLGGVNSLRGYREYRFQDRNALLFNVEYRWLVWSGLDMALFLDAGNVYPRAKDISLEDLKTSYGIGFRVNTSYAVMLRIDIGHSEEGTLIHMQFNHVF
ncbi:MAG: BamA/TamA family outer membrane protein, partial [bacterium]